MLFRPTEINYPDGGQVNIGYASYNGFMYSVVSNGVSSSYTSYDLLGRPFRSAVSNGESSPYNQVDTCYDARGNIGFQSYPYQSTGFNVSPICSGAGDTYSYDAINRVTQIAHPDGTAVATAYSGRATCVSDEGNGTQQVERCSQADGWHVTSIACEVTGTAVLGNGGTPGNCNQDSGGTGFLTTYAYDAMNNLVGVSQGGLNRAFNYDSMNRLSSVSNPESGTTSYAYRYSDGVTLCAGDLSLPCARTDARSIRTVYTYDSLNRLTARYYSDNTPTAFIFTMMQVHGGAIPYQIR